ncbi:tetratricopeptide repeat protein [Corallococcus llansteffanensis]|uniref:Tetratricopeptide repeat protein n=2 Tax=Corallococcus llansteffanensis TaxID=2316731 RepID=A0A3A8NM11_9BACT|nr:tetratricopeptide repeat protein [Corallococcus llansteffanensis]
MPQSTLYRWATTAHQLLQVGKTQQALDIFKGLVAAAPHDSVFHCQLGAALMTLERFDEAFDAFQRSLQLNADNGDALVGRGEIHLRRGNVPAGLADFSSAIQNDPTLQRRSTQRARSLLVTLKQQADQAQKSATAKTPPKK